jgi:hypothetical protein
MSGWIYASEKSVWFLNQKRHFSARCNRANQADEKQ